MGGDVSPADSGLYHATCFTPGGVAVPQSGISPLPVFRMPRPIQATIHTASLRHNLARARTAAPDARAWAVVKANAYGHGIEAVFEGLRGADGFALLDLLEAEYVRDIHARADTYFYAWSELGFRPVDWLRAGIAGQRTNIYGGGRDIQRGPFAQVTWERVTIGGYWFNPGSSEQVFVGMIGVTF